MVKFKNIPDNLNQQPLPLVYLDSVIAASGCFWVNLDIKSDINLVPADCLYVFVSWAISNARIFVASCSETCSLDLGSTSAQDDGEVQEHPGQLEPAASAAGVS